MTKKKKSLLPSISPYLIIILSLSIIGFSFKYGFKNILDIFSLSSKGIIEENDFQDLKIAIKNGCGINNLGRLYKNYLIDIGCDITGFSDAENYGNTFTKIHFHKNNKASAEKLANHLGISKNQIYEKTDLEEYQDLTLVLGQDYSKLKSYNNVKEFNPFK